MVVVSNVGSILYYTRREEGSGEMGLRIDLYLNPLVTLASVNVFSRTVDMKLSWQSTLLILQLD